MGRGATERLGRPSAAGGGGWPPLSAGWSPRWLVLIGAVVFFACAVWTGFSAIDPLGRWIETDGVVDTVVSQAADGDTLMVRFTAPGGRVVTFMGSEDKAIGHYAVGEPLNVRYRASDPTDAHIAASSRRAAVAVVVIAGAGVGCVFLARAKGLHWGGV